MVVPVTVNKEKMVLVQATGLQAEEKEELLMKLIVLTLEQALSLFLALKVQRELAERIDKIGSLTAGISESRTHHRLSNCIFKILP